MIAGIALLIAAATYRLLPIFMEVSTQQPSWLPGFSPLVAMILCSAAFLPRRTAIILPFATILFTDIALNNFYKSPALTPDMAGNFAAFAAIAFLGWRLRSRAGFSTMLPAAIASSIFFYFVSNSLSWILIPEYAKTFSGWFQALTTGLPGYAPTWTFLRNELVSNTLFTALFVICMKRGSVKTPTTELAPARW
ncbi:MAG: hypothetical protein RL088_2604 [Verrucomicrobiota bacterium]|jgi:hypothetical protein